MSQAQLTNLSKLDVWLLARCAIGYRAEAPHMKEATPAVAKLLLYLDGINYRDRDLLMRQQLDAPEYTRVVGADPESRCPLAPAFEVERNWQIMHASELKNLPPVEWLVPGELPRGGLVVVFGQSGAGKSFLSLDYALKLAQEHAVVYIAGEGEWGYHQRVAAWCQHNRQQEGKLYICVGAVNLYDAADFGAFEEQITAHAPALVVVDTLAMCMTGANENDTRDMGLVIRACKTIQRRLGCAVVVVHHVNKGGVSERGSGALRGAADVMIKVSQMDDVIAVEASKTKDVAAFPTRYIRLLPVVVGKDAHGDDITSVVAVPSDKVIQSENDALTINQRKVLESLALDAFNGGASLTDITEVSEVNRGTLWRTISRLINMGHISKNGALYQLTDKGKTAIGVDSVDSVAGSTIEKAAVVKTSLQQSQHPQQSQQMQQDDDALQLTFDEMQQTQRRVPNQYERGY